MKKIIQIFIILAVFSGSIFSQNNTKYKFISLPFIKGEALVFTKFYSPPILLVNKKELFTPLEQEIKKAELILYDRYNKDLKDIVWYKPEKNVQNKYRKYNRQYLGYIDKSGNKKIIINLLNFKCKKKAKKKFEGWMEGFFVGFGQYYEKNMIIYEVDLENNRLKVF